MRRSAPSSLFLQNYFATVFFCTPYKDGRAKLLGYLDDYAFTAVGLLDIYEALFDRSALSRAIELTEIMLREFWDEQDGGFFSTGNSHEKLISRAKPIFDASIPSGNAYGDAAVAALVPYHRRGAIFSLLRKKCCALTMTPWRASRSVSRICYARWIFT